MQKTCTRRCLQCSPRPGILEEKGEQNGPDVTGSKFEKPLSHSSTSTNLIGARLRGQASDTRLCEPAENSSALNISFTFSFPTCRTMHPWENKMQVTTRVCNLPRKIGNAACESFPPFLQHCARASENACGSDEFPSAASTYVSGFTSCSTKSSVLVSKYT